MGASKAIGFFMLCLLAAATCAKGARAEKRVGTTVATASPLVDYPRDFHTDIG